MSFTPPRLRSGFDLRQAAHELLEETRAATILRGRRALLLTLLKHDRATADDVRSMVTLPEGVNPVVFGVIPTALANAGIITADGFEKSRRACTHARPLTVWRLVDRSAALCWLNTHPDRPDQPQNAEALDEQSEFDFENKNGGPGAGTPGNA